MPTDRAKSLFSTMLAIPSHRYLRCLNDLALCNKEHEHKRNHAHHRCSHLDFPNGASFSTDVVSDQWISRSAITEIPNSSGNA